MDEHRCTSDQLCAACYGRERLAKRGQAEAIGQVWPERVSRGELRAQPTWPEHEPRTLAIARGLVGQLACDPRLVEDLARACSAGAAAWWQRRPMRYRIEPATWSLETAPDERERCTFVGDGVRCDRRTGWLIGNVAELAYVCGVHLEFVRRPGQPAEIVEQGRAATSNSAPGPAAR